MPLIVIPDDEPSVMAPSLAFQGLSTSDVRIYSSRPTSQSDLVDRIREAEIVINIRATSRFSNEVLKNATKLRMISIWGTGTDHVDLAAAKTLKIRVTNTPGVSAIAVAEHTLSLMMAAARQTVKVDSEVRAGKWPRASVTQLRGKTLGLIGTGAIGCEVAKLGRAIGMNVIAWTFHPAGSIAEWVAFDDVFRWSDILSVHVRQSVQTEGMIGRAQFELMKPTAIFINTARGAIVREPDLIEVLAKQHIAAAGLDVFETEPLPATSPLFLLENVVLSPHSAGITPEATEAGLALAIENVFDWMAGNARNVVA